ncbi:MAG: sulfite reductase (ferredoxin), partial [Patiriisocius sp.]
GMSVRTPDKKVAPALQVLLGGGNKGNGQGVFADKVVKMPSRRGPEALRRILNDFEAHGNGQLYMDYYKSQGEKYFYDMLTDLSDVSNLSQEDFIDWGESQDYVKAIGIGECAGVVIDLISTLFLESEEKIEEGKNAMNKDLYANVIYFAYRSIINSAKAMLLSENQKTNTQSGIISQFAEIFVETGKINIGESFSKFVHQIRENEPSKEFAQHYLENAQRFTAIVKTYRENEMKN